MKKLISILVLLTICIQSFVFADRIILENSVEVLVDGERLDTFDTEQGINLPAFIYENRTMMPLRKTFEVFGISGDNIKWIPEERAVLVTTNNLDELWIQIDNPEIKINGEAVNAGLPAKIFENRTYIPVSMVASLLGEIPVWDGETRRVLLNPSTYNLKRLDLSFVLSKREGYVFDERASGLSYRLVKLQEDAVAPVSTILITQYRETLNQHFDKYLNETLLSSDDFLFFSDDNDAYIRTAGLNSVVLFEGPFGYAIRIEAHNVSDDILTEIVDSLKEVK
jgi:hypothetical protein